MSSRDDDGSATVLLLSLAGVLAMVAALGAAVGAVAVARHRAAAAADLAALAAADRALDGEQVACKAALAATRPVGALLTGCRLSGDIADVEVVVRPPGVLGSWGLAQARARAGPSSLPTSHDETGFHRSSGSVGSRGMARSDSRAGRSGR